MKVGQQIMKELAEFDKLFEEAPIERNELVAKLKAREIYRMARNGFALFFPLR